MATKSAVLARVAVNLTEVASLTAIYAPAASPPSVQELPELLTSWPCAILLPGEAPVIPGHWERQTWNVAGSIWVTEQPRGERVQQLTDIADEVLAAFRVPNVTAVDAGVQSVILTGFGAITGQQWTRGDGAPWFLVLPFSLELKVNRSVTYGPA
jgi:hypothetical protein